MNEEYITTQVRLAQEEVPTPYQAAFNASSHAYSDAAMAGECHQEALRCALLAALPFLPDKPFPPRFQEDSG